jgi:hypothetical protein
VKAIPCPLFCNTQSIPGPPNMCSTIASATSPRFVPNLLFARSGNSFVVKFVVLVGSAAKFSFMLEDLHLDLQVSDPVFIEASQPVAVFATVTMPGGPSFSGRVSLTESVRLPGGFGVRCSHFINSSTQETGTQLTVVQL